MTTRAAELASLVEAFDEASLMERPTLALLDEMEQAGAVEAAS